MSIILPRGRDIVSTRVDRWEMKTYAELYSDVQKQRIKSLCDNKIDGNKGTISMIMDEPMVDEDGFEVDVDFSARFLVMDDVNVL